MGITSRASDPVGVTNTSGQPEIVLEIAGLTLSMTPPSLDDAALDDAATDDDSDDDTE